MIHLCYMISYKMSQSEHQQQIEEAQQQSHQQNEEAQQQTQNLPQQQQSHHTHEEDASAGSHSEPASRQRKKRSQTSWPTDVMSVGEVNDEGLPLDTRVNTRLSRVCGLAAPAKGVANPAGIQ